MKKDRADHGFRFKLTLGAELSSHSYFLPFSHKLLIRALIAKLKC